jgi:hypothetical protein
MDEQTRIFLWTVIAAGGFAMIGAAFGALTGAMTWRDGRAGGTALGLAVARAYERIAQEDLPVAWKGGLIGGTDGFIFFGLIGGLVGCWAGVRGVGWEVLGTLLLYGGALAFGAVFLGVLAYALIAGNARSVAALFGGGIVGAYVGYRAGETNGLLAGLLIGGILGVISSLCYR